MKYVKVGSLELSKVICGTNPFYARSHFSLARDKEYRARFDDRRIEQILAHCLESGINAVDSSANENIVERLSSVRAQTGKPLHLIGSNRVDATSQMRTHDEKLDFLLEQRAEICVVHAQMADAQRKDGEIPGLERAIDRIHEAGLLAGISTHKVDTVAYCEQRGLEIDAYLFPLNAMGVVYPGYKGTDTLQARVDLVQGVAKPFILIKVLGAGRIPPDEALQFVLERAKPGDAFCLGFGSEDEVEEAVRIVDKHYA